jgi:beta-lactamase family protein/fibronectin type III domain protein
MRARRRRGHRVLALAAAVTGLTCVAGPPGTAAAATPATIARLGAAIAMAPDAAGPDVLAAVSCPSVRSCVAVGADASGRAVVAAGAEAQGRWRWSPASALPAGPGGADQLRGVSCPTATACVAVGTDGSGQGEVAVGAMDRGSWRWGAPTTLAPDLTAGGTLASVSCPTATTCVAVGSDAASQGIVTTGARRGAAWSWTPAEPIAPDGTGSGTLASVSCGSASSCVAVGVDAGSDGIVTAGVAHAGGWSWSPAASVAAGDPLVGVSCASTSWCAAVGDDPGGRGVFTTGTWASTSWSWQPAAPLSQPATVAAIGCRTTQLCVAVGHEPATPAASNEYELGHQVAGDLVWASARSAPSAGTPASSLAAVSCAALDACTAVGATPDGGAVVVPSVARPAPARIVRADRGNASASVAWRPPAFDGGVRVASYRVAATPGGATCVVVARGAGAQRCTVQHLINGERYRFTVTADNGIGLSPPSPPSAPVVPSPFQPPISSPLTPAVLRIVATTPDVVAATVYDVLTGQTWRVNPSSVQHTASMVKVDILACLLYDEQVAHATMSPSTRQLATEMIEESDNDAAQALYVQIGQLPGMAAFNARIGLTGTTANWAWGYTDTTSLDQTRVMRLFVLPNDVLDAASRTFGLGLMEHVDPAQAWGVSAGPPPSAHVALKNGWYPTAPLDWQVNSVGWIDGDGRDYVLAVLTTDDATMGVGVTTIETLSTMVWRRLGEHAPASR